MTDEEFDQVLRDMATMLDAHPDTATISLPPALADEFEKRRSDQPQQQR